MSDTRRVGKALRALTLLICATLSSCCKREVQARHLSPSGTKVLSVVRVDCAAFDSFRTELHLADDKGTVHDQTIATISGSPVMQVTWADDFSVIVFAPKGHHVDIRKKQVDGVRVDFRY